jgi:thiamine biosynthesis lipoprotein
MKPLLGTFVEVSATGGDESAVDAAFHAIDTVQRVASFQDAASDLSRLNRACGTACRVHPVLVRLLRIARVLGIASGGLFNATVAGALIRRGALPDPGGTPAPDCGNASDIQVRGNLVRLDRGVWVTLDGLAKGFAVDLAVRALKRHGATAGAVNAGGDLRCFGANVIPVLRRNVDGRPVALGGLQNAAIATSHAVCEQNVDMPGLVVAGDGQPAASGVWSVIARQCWRADALTKVAALASASERAAIIRRLGGQLVLPALEREAA